MLIVCHFDIFVFGIRNMPSFFVVYLGYYLSFSFVCLVGLVGFFFGGGGGFCSIFGKNVRLGFFSKKYK